ncbi:hypothetical protein [Alsobacter sp. R-9]
MAPRAKQGLAGSPERCYRSIMGRMLGIILLGVVSVIAAGPAAAWTAPPFDDPTELALPGAADGLLKAHAEGMQGAGSTGEAEAGVHPAGTEFPCTCRAAGRTFDMGETTCLATPEGLRLARCVMVLNNTSWEIMRTPCPSTRLGDEASPAG